MSGTGKSTLIRELSALGYKAVDADEPGWSEYRVAAPPERAPTDPEWLWREDRIQRLLSTEDAEVLFISGCASNQVRFYKQFDHVVLLSAPVPVMIERLATRTTNNFGKDPDELAQVLNDQRAIEPLLRNAATAELDTCAPLDGLVAAVLALVGGPHHH